MRKTHHYIYNDEDIQFAIKLIQFHREFDTKLIACGVDKSYQNLDTVRWSSLNYDKSYRDRVIDGFRRDTPGAHVMLVDENQNKCFECVISGILSYHIKEANNKLIDGYYMIQNALDYPKQESCMYQLWELGEWTDLESVKEFWYD